MEKKDFYISKAICKNLLYLDNNVTLKVKWNLKWNFDMQPMQDAM